LNVNNECKGRVLIGDSGQTTRQIREDFGNSDFEIDECSNQIAIVVWAGMNDALQLVNPLIMHSRGKITKEEAEEAIVKKFNNAKKEWEMLYSNVKDTVHRQIPQAKVLLLAINVPYISRSKEMNPHYSNASNMERINRFIYGLNLKKQETCQSEGGWFQCGLMGMSWAKREGVGDGVHFGPKRNMDIANEISKRINVWAEEADE
jgi:hypothetical protein